MRKELDEALVAKYPKIFVDRYGNMQQTAMCWGFECGDGWYNIIDTLCGIIQSTIDHANKDRERAIMWNQMLEDCAHGDYRLFNEYYSWSTDAGRAAKMETISEEKPRDVPPEHGQVIATQVKEKFGGLRFYVNGATDKIYNYISFAETMSYKTCEVCGSPGKTYTDGWHQTLCDIHAEMNGRSEEYEYEELEGE